MDKQIPANVGLMDEFFKDNLRIRLHQFQTIDGSLTCLVEVSAWNEWAGQSKVLYALGGLELQDAKGLFATLTEHLLRYDWHEGAFLWEET